MTKSFDEIPMGTVLLIKMLHQKPDRFAWHLHFKDSINWYSCTHIRHPSMNEKESEPFRKYLTVWEYPEPIQPAY
jgi:hypothetical protein